VFSPSKLYSITRATIRKHFSICHYYGGIKGTSEIFYLSRANAMGDISNILSITCARDGGYQKYFIYHVRTRWGTSEIFYLSRAHAMGTSEIFYLSRAHAIEDIRNIVSVTCARMGDIGKYLNTPCARDSYHAMTTMCAIDSYYVRTYNLLRAHT
jgi:hypothetical protein